MAKTNPSPTFPMYPGDAATFTNSDTARFSPSIIWVGTAGVIRVRTAEGTDITFTGAQSGTVLPVQVISVFNTTTTATNLVRIF
jgi:hypothetical protein